MVQPASHLPAGQVHDDFTTWAGQNGITIQKVKVSAIQNAGIGIVATEDIKVLYIYTRSALQLAVFRNGGSLSESGRDYHMLRHTCRCHLVFLLST